jgi:hypothetical protein
MSQHPSDPTISRLQRFVRIAGGDGGVAKQVPRMGMLVEKRDEAYISFRLSAIKCFVSTTGSTSESDSME